MRPLIYSINITLDGCTAHDVGMPDAELHAYHARNLEQADAMLCGRVIYEMMESAWRPPAESGVPPEWMAEWMMPFARTIHATKKYVVSRTLTQVDWNAELVRGDVVESVRALKAQRGNGMLVSGVTLPLFLAKHGLIDEYDIVVHPRIVGRGPSLLAGLSEFVDLTLRGRTEFTSGAMALRYVPRLPAL